MWHNVTAPIARFGVKPMLSKSSRFLITQIKKQLLSEEQLLVNKTGLSTHHTKIEIHSHNFKCGIVSEAHRLQTVDEPLAIYFSFRPVQLHNKISESDLILAQLYKDSCRYQTSKKPA
jgi:hypothetical protein